eukprot:3296690-Amphidinium_carterae.1
MSALVLQAVEVLRDIVREDVFTDLLAVAHNHVELIGQKKVVLESGTAVIRDTLFSGDPLTQSVKSLLNHLISMAAAARIQKDVELSIKGDDCGALHSDEATARAFIEAKQEVGIVIHQDKLHLEVSMLELERCAVAPSGFRASLPRKIFAIVYAEPQGSTGLSRREMVSVAYETGRELQRRGGNPAGCAKIVKAILRTADFSVDQINMLEKF